MVSLAVIVCLIPVPGVSLGSEIKPENNSAFSVSSLTIPTHLGSIQKSFQGEKNQTVIYIQDAHTNYEAQVHISGILEYLTETYGINRVNTEGADGPVDLALFKALPFPEIKKEILEKDMRSGSTAGVEFFAMTSHKDIGLFGVDSDGHYLKNVGQYASLARKRKMYSQVVTFFQKIVDNLKSVMYSEEARAVDRLIKKNNRKHIPMDHFMKELLIYSKKASVDLSDYPTVMELSKILEGSNQTAIASKAGSSFRHPRESGDLENVDSRFRGNDKGLEITSPPRSDDARGIGKISTPLHPAENWVGRLFQPAVAEASGQLLTPSPSQNAGGASRPADPRAGRPGYAAGPEGVDAKKLFDELDEIKEELLNAFSANSETKELIRLDRYLELLRQGLDLKLIPDDVKLLRRLRKEFKEDYLRNYLSALSRRHRLNEPALQKVLDSGLDDFSKSVLDFYETVETRDEIMVKNLKRSTGQENPISILVAGGFHTVGVTERLRKEKVSYVVIQPNISAVLNENSYQELMLKWGDIVSARATVRTLMSQAVYQADRQIALQLADARYRSLLPFYRRFAERVIASGKITPAQFKRELETRSSGKLFVLISRRGIAVFSLDTFLKTLALAGPLGVNMDDFLSRYAAVFPVKIEQIPTASEPTTPRREPVKVPIPERVPRREPKPAPSKPLPQPKPQPLPVTPTPEREPMTVPAGFGAEAPKEATPPDLSGSWHSDEVERLELLIDSDQAGNLERIGQALGERRTVVIPFEFFDFMDKIVGTKKFHAFFTLAGSAGSDSFYEIQRFLKDDLNLAVNLAGIEHKSVLEKLQKNRLILVHVDSASAALVVDGYYIARKEAGVWAEEDNGKKKLIKSGLLEKVLARHGEPLASSLLEIAELEGLANHEQIEKEWHEQHKKLVSMLRQFGSAQWGTVFNQDGYHERFDLSRPLKPVAYPFDYKMPEAHERFVKNFVTIVGTSPPNFYANIKSSRRFGSLNVWPSPFIKLLTIEYQRFRFQKTISTKSKKFRQMAALAATPHYLGPAEQRSLEFSRRHKELVSFWRQKHGDLTPDLLFAEAAADLEYYRSPLSDLINDILGIDVAKQIAEDRARRSTSVQVQAEKAELPTSGKKLSADDLAWLEKKLSSVDEAYRSSEYQRFAEELLMLPPKIQSRLVKLGGKIWYANFVKMKWGEAAYLRNHERILKLLASNGVRTPNALAEAIPESFYIYSEDVGGFETPLLDFVQGVILAYREYVREHTDKERMRNLASKPPTQPSPSWLKQIGVGVLGLVQPWPNRPSTAPFLKGKPTEADRKAVERPRVPETIAKPAEVPVKAPAVSQEASVVETAETTTLLPSIEPFREVTRAELDKMAGKLAALDASLIHNDARVTFKEIYDAFNPEELDDSLLSQPQVRKLVESIFENLRTLSNATQAPKIPSEASKLRGRLNYLRNRLAELENRQPARVIEEPEKAAEGTAESPAPPEPTAEAGFGVVTANPAKRAARYYVTRFPQETASAIGFDNESMAADYLARAIAADPARALEQLEKSRDRLVEMFSKEKFVFGPGGNRLLEKLQKLGDEKIQKAIFAKRWDVAVLQNSSYPNRLNQLPAFISELLLTDRNSLDQRLLSADSNAATLRKQLESIGFYGVPLNYLLDAREELGNFVNSLSPEQQARFSSEVDRLQAYITHYLMASKALSIAA